MPKAKAPNNRTIDTSLEQGGDYLSRCRQVSLPVQDISQLENNVIWGDTFNTLPLLPPESVDLVIVDPPYNLTKQYDSGTFNRRKEEEYQKYTRSWMELAAPLLKTGGTIYVCCDWKSSLVIAPVLREFFTLRNRITWQREKGRGARANWKNGMEDIWFATKGDGYTFCLDQVKLRRKVMAPYRAGGKPKDWVEDEEGNYRDTCPSNFWDDITVPFWSMQENTPHPTQKPEKLMAKLILASSRPGELVFDPFLGSGTTAVTAKKLGRKYLGIEASGQYCVWAQQRLEMAETQKEIQGYRNGIFWQRNSGK